MGSAYYYGDFSTCKAESLNQYDDKYTPQYRMDVVGV
jgi:hypothetical protein